MVTRKLMMASLLKDPLFEVSGRGPPPNKTFYYFAIIKSVVIWRWWKISLRVVDRNSRPGEVKESHQELLEDSWLQREITNVFGRETMEYAKTLCQGNYNYLEHLSDALLLHIINYLELEDVGQLARTSRRFRQLCQSEEFWEKAVRQRWNTVSNEVSALAFDIGWRCIFFANKLHLQMLLNRRRIKLQGELEHQDCDQEAGPGQSTDGKSTETKEEEDESGWSTSLNLDSDKKLSSDGQTNLDSDEKQSSDGLANLDSDKKQSSDGFANLDGVKKPSSYGLTNLDSDEKQSSDGLTNLDSDEKQSSDGLTNLDSDEKQSSDGLTNLDSDEKQSSDSLANLDSDEKQSSDSLANLYSDEKQSSDSLANLDSDKKQSSDSLANLDSDEKQSSDSLANLYSDEKQSSDGLANLDSDKKQSSDSLANLDSDKKQSSDGLANLDSVKKQSSDGLTNLGSDEKLSIDSPIPSLDNSFSFSLSDLTSASSLDEDFLEDLKNLGELKLAQSSKPENDREDVPLVSENAESA